MEDLITIVIIIIGVAIKIFSSVKKRGSDTDKPAEQELAWDEFLDEVEKSPELQDMVQNDPELQDSYRQARAYKEAQEKAVRDAQRERDKAILEEQRKLAENASKASAVNQSAMAEESSAVYAETFAENSEKDNEDPGDWAELIRNNRKEAIVISEILAPPAALR